MIQGTASSVGKSLIVAALCRIFKQAGEKVAPFKSQNMALNSFVTGKGKEMGRAQVVQAEAAGVEPDVLMNPILLKPTSDKKAQIILNGEVYNNLDAAEYHSYKAEARKHVEEAYQKLSEKYELVVIEGAGSPAEINLRENDLVNMGMAEIADAPVILVGDIDKGGVFAAIVGTLFLLSEEEKKRVRGVIINKFRGDLELLKPGIKMLEDIIKIPVLGVVPYGEFYIEEEDSVTERFIQKKTEGEIEVAVLRLPYMSNYTDFDVFKIFADINFSYINHADELNDPDLLIIPGSKNTIADLTYLKNSGLAEKIYRLNKAGKLIIGICGGYQMLGQTIEDPYAIESNQVRCNGLGLLKINTLLKQEKKLEQISAKIENSDGFMQNLKGQGYLYSRIF
jgi:adenosylcobyric acid synthase